MKTSERCQWRRTDVFIVNFEHISHIFLVFLLLTLNKELLTRFIVGFKHIEHNMKHIIMLL